MGFDLSVCEFTKGSEKVLDRLLYLSKIPAIKVESVYRFTFYSIDTYFDVLTTDSF